MDTFTKYVGQLYNLDEIILDKCNISKIVNINCITVIDSTVSSGSINRVTYHSGDISGIVVDELDVMCDDPCMSINAKKITFHGNVDLDKIKFLNTSDVYIILPCKLYSDVTLKSINGIHIGKVCLPNVEIVQLHGDNVELVGRSNNVILNTMNKHPQIVADCKSLTINKEVGALYINNLKLDDKMVLNAPVIMLDRIKGKGTVNIICELLTMNNSRFNNLHLMKIKHLQGRIGVNNLTGSIDDLNLDILNTYYIHVKCKNVYGSTYMAEQIVLDSENWAIKNIHAKDIHLTLRKYVAVGDIRCIRAQTLMVESDTECHPLAFLDSEVHRYKFSKNLEAAEYICNTCNEL